MLAKIVNDHAGILNARVALAFFASKLAPTVMVLNKKIACWVSPESGNGTTRSMFVGTPHPWPA
ncbi:hypothetical protein DL347_08415 [Pseudomonas fluorescens]|uniref:Uncharacterized protein n=1 Tax=Pseudomonas fluorescens TaxID=294 RepID=A0A7Z6QQ31_PSEFL|nr:hypothetical protein DL347_08415 [Pseudomonas fluorescens]